MLDCSSRAANTLSTWDLLGRFSSVSRKHNYALVVAAMAVVQHCVIKDCVLVLDRNLIIAAIGRIT